MTDTEKKPDPKALVPEFADLNDQNKEFIARCVALYCKHLDTLGADAQKLGRLAEATRAGKDSEWLRGDLVTPILGDDEGANVTGTMEVQLRHLPLIHLGLGMLVKNMKAARGTLTPLGYPRTVEKLYEHASYVEGQLMPRFAEQTELLSEIPKPGSGPMLVPDDEPDVPLADMVRELEHPPASEVTGLRTVAEAMAE